MNSARYEEQHAAFVQAVGTGQMLYGRNEEFDAFLRKLRKLPRLGSRCRWRSRTLCCCWRV